MTTLGNICFYFMVMSVCQHLYLFTICRQNLEEGNGSLNLCYRQLWTITCVLAIEPCFSGPITSAVIHWAISPAPNLCISGLCWVKNRNPRKGCNIMKYVLPSLFWYISLYCDKHLTSNFRVEGYVWPMVQEEKQSIMEGRHVGRTT